MTSTLKIYKNCPILPDKNFILDNFRLYLDHAQGVTSVKIEDFQYIKHALDLEIKIESAQADLEFISSNHTNYISIKNDDSSKVCYYFIIDKKWTSKDCIKLMLEMDTLNTFTYGTDYSMTDKTLIIRQHLDRFINDYTSGGHKYAQRVIKRESEGITPLLKRNVSETRKLTQSIDDDWYLIYRSTEEITANTNCPIECFVCAKNPIPLNVIPAVTKHIANLTIGREFFWTTYDHNALNTSELGFNIPKAIEGYRYGIMLYRLDNSRAFIEIVVWPENDDNVAGQSILMKELDNDAEVSFYGNGNLWHRYFDSNSHQLPKWNELSQRYQDRSGEYQLYQVAGIDSIDRSDSKLMKIIKLPYAPLLFYEIGNVYATDNNILYPSRIDVGGRSAPILKLNDFDSSIKSDISFNINPLNNLLVDFGASLDMHASKNIIYESKLFHSDYYMPKFFYDSFGKAIKLEEISTDSISTEITKPSFNIEFFKSKLINSSMLFKFKDYKPQYSIEDIDSILIANRNNEDIIYTNNYLTYMRTGYNYDVKNKNIDNVTGFIKAGMSVVGSGAQIAGGDILGGGMGIANTILNTAVSTTKRELAFQQKQDQMKAQASSFSSSDDLDLMSEYCGNRMLYALYEPTDEVKEKLWDLFYFCGYSVDKQGIPDTNTRYWFNFVQCNPVFNIVANIPQMIIDDLKNKYSEGVTFLHGHIASGDILYYEYDFNQQYENWEASLL